MNSNPANEGYITKDKEKICPWKTLKTSVKKKNHLRFCAC